MLLHHHDEPTIASNPLAQLAAAVQRARTHGAVRFGAVVLALLTAIALAAPWLGTVDPALFDPASRDLRPGAYGEITTLDGQTIKHRFLMGSDSAGRDIYSRVLYGTRAALLVGLGAVLVALPSGLLLGLLAAYQRKLDAPLMAVMNALTAIPALLIAITLVATWRGGLVTVVMAIAIPQIPRVARLVHSQVRAQRDQPYVEAAVALGTSPAVILLRHVLPGVIAPLVVQASFIAGAAILTEAIVSFLGLGLPPDVPSWGNVMAEARARFAQHPLAIFFPGLFLTLTVLAVHVLGDGLRATLAPETGARA